MTDAVPGTRVITYARVSSETQKDDETIAIQRDKLQSFVEGVESVDVLHLEDEAKSGETIAARPSFKKILKLAEQKAFDLLVVTKTDRLTRSSDEMERALIAKTLRLAGVKIAVINAGTTIDLSNPTQNLMFSITSDFASFDKSQILRNTYEGRVKKVKDGGRNSCGDPFGYRWVTDPGARRRGSYEIVEAEAKVIRDLVRRSIEGASISKLLIYLNENEIPFRVWTRNPKGLWSRSTLTGLLHSPTIKGEFGALGGKHVIRVPPIIDDDTWRRMHLEMSRRGSVRGDTAGREDALLMGRVRCGVCGLACSTDRGGTHHLERLRRYYRCRTVGRWRELRLSGPCDGKRRRAIHLDAAVWDDLKVLLTSPEILARCASLQADEVKAGVDFRADLEKWTKKLDHLGKVASETMRRRRLDRITEEECDAQLDEIARERKLLERQVQVARDQIANSGQTHVWLERLETFAKELRGELDDFTFAERLEVVSKVLPKGRGWVEIHPDGTHTIRGVIVRDGHELRFTAEPGDLKTA